jgi:pimeloyl-ACP methyl ester carboxylesterase
MAHVTLPDGCKIHYREYDFADPWIDRPTVILLHGFCRYGDFWYRWIPVIAKRFRVLVPDLRGVGGSDVPAPGFPWSLTQFHDDLLAFMDAVGLDRAHVVGESMGGMVMPFIANRSPQRIASVVACSSNLGVRGAMAVAMAGGAASMTDAITSAPTLQDYALRTDGTRLAHAETSAAERQWFADAWAATARHIWHEWSAVLVPTIDVTPELLAGLECPLLFMGPTRCVKLSQDEARFWTDHAPDAELQFVDSASQSLFYAKAEECAERTVEFLLRRFVQPAPGAAATTATMEARHV